MTAPDAVLDEGELPVVVGVSKARGVADQEEGSSGAEGPSDMAWAVAASERRRSAPPHSSSSDLGDGTALGLRGILKEDVYLCVCESCMYLIAWRSRLQELSTVLVDCVGLLLELLSL